MTSTFAHANILSNAYHMSVNQKMILTLKSEVVIRTKTLRGEQDHI